MIGGRIGPKKEKKRSGWGYISAKWWGSITLRRCSRDGRGCVCEYKQDLEEKVHVYHSVWQQLGSKQQKRKLERLSVFPSMSQLKLGHEPQKTSAKRPSDVHRRSSNSPTVCCNFCQSRCQEILNKGSEFWDKWEIQINTIKCARSEGVWILSKAAV